MKRELVPPFFLHYTAIKPCHFPDGHAPSPKEKRRFDILYRGDKDKSPPYPRRVTTHISDRSFWEALEYYPGPILASHQNCRALAPGERQFTDEQLRAVIERDGVIGASMDTWMLCEKLDIDWASTGDYERRDYFAREAVTLEHIANHVDHVCQLAGNALHAGIGGDTDGQGGVDVQGFDLQVINS